MAVSSLMSLGAQAMYANYAALQTTGNNIANANTEGYSRQQAELETAPAQSSGSGFFGRGVNVKTVTRLHDEFLTREAAATRSAASADETMSKQLQQLELVFQTGESGLGNAVSQLLNSFADVASKPQDISARQVVLARADEFASRFRTASGQLSALQTGVTQDLKASVDTVNSLTKQIASLNQQISTLTGSGHSPNDLLDLRDSTLSKLSEMLQINTVAANDGSVSVFLSGGQTLVQGAVAAQLTTQPDAFDPSRFQVAMRTGGVVRELPANTLTGGSISALVSFQNHDLVDARNQLGQLALGISDQLNRQQSLGVDLNGKAGAALLSIAAPQVLPSSANTGGASIALTVAASSQVRASDYELARDSAGSYSLRRLSDNHLFGPPEIANLTPAALAAGFQVDGITIRLGSAAEPAVGDRFRLQPVAAAARDISLAMADPRGLAAASPISASTTVDNSGTLSIDRLNVLAPVSTPVTDVLLRFDRDPVTQATTYTYSTDGGATFSAAPQTLLPNQPITFPVGSSSPQWSLGVQGSPAPGDTVLIRQTVTPSNNNGNANAMLGLRDAVMVGAEVDNQTGALTYGGSSFNDAYAGMLSDFGVRVQTAKAVARQSSVVAESAKTIASNTSGVNLDEEAARMIQFQQTYQAAAKMLQVAQALFDSMLQATSR
ncbi:MAG: flagellar hook-associated protein FlgK [Ideonella sp.]